MVKTWKTGKLELFDVSKDLSEAKDLSLAMPEKTKEVDQTLTAFLAQVKATTVQTTAGKDKRRRGGTASHFCRWGEPSSPRRLIGFGVGSGVC